MSKKKTNITTKAQVKALIEEIRIKYEPDFIAIWKDPYEVHFKTVDPMINISFGWNIDSPKHKKHKKEKTR